ncbi:hypothetical protein [Amphritea sp. HPY]|uniref:hypothetical protein n=1 Tax=Amphritea sp. HPY TaxID=3421652 RepID=UPI003D7EEA4A
MLSTIFNLLKVATVIFYLLALASLVIEPLHGFQMILLTIVAALAIAHAAEFLLVRNKLALIEKAAGHHLLNVMLFGFLYWIPLLYTDNANSNT